MDPLTALSLAGTIIQFIHFASTLFNGVQQIHASATGTSAESENLKNICERLLQFAASLQVKDQNQTVAAGSGSNLSGYGPELRRLAAQCEADCKQLLEIVSRLNVETGSGLRWWRSLRVALAEASKSSDVKALKQRINYNQQSMILRFCALSKLMRSEGIAMLSAQLSELTSITQTNSRRTEQLFNISNSLEDAASAIRKIQSDHVQNKLSSEDFDQVTSRVLDLCPRSRKFGRQYWVLSSLDYEKRPDRCESIPEAHKKTFGWVFSNPRIHEDSGSGIQQDRFVRWLTKGDGIFWVSGKPGSGKSTFMKFVASHTETKNALKTWAGTRKVAIACHYFWAAGSSIQKSHKGLLQSLLYDILDQYPDLMETVSPGRWMLSNKDRSPPKPWTLSELLDAIRKLKGQTELPVRFCFFIDGLDEYIGDHAELCQAIKELSQSPSIKICLSSRPWNVFEESFGGESSTKFYVHDLTWQDIQAYANSRLCEHPWWATIDEGSEGTSALLEEITGRAKGVFLWVFLVTRELREGLTNNDPMKDLWKRLDAIPTDLEQFFKHILASVGQSYVEKMAGTLSVALAAREPLPTEIYSHHELEYEDEHYSMRGPPEPWKMKTFLEPLARRLNARSKGLLEINHGRVEFLHRTVSDFLRTGEMSKFISERARPRFDSNLSIFKAYVSWIKHLHILRFDLIVVALSYARHSVDYGDRNHTFLDEHIDHFGWCFQTMFIMKEKSYRNISHGFARSSPDLLFKQYVLSADLVAYMAKKHRENCYYLCDLSRWEISQVLGPDSADEYARNFQHSASKRHKYFRKPITEASINRRNMESRRGRTGQQRGHTTRNSLALGRNEFTSEVNHSHNERGRGRGRGRGGYRFQSSQRVQWDDGGRRGYSAFGQVGRGSETVSGASRGQAYAMNGSDVYYR
ncbi:hypothetical protein O1611_g4229 [Lasiodiplodia mahajangana]|uniref:Uncharacterized protein n=1 Tax=Lasiodiplodia mahajangana TaxID=1108764 RepID=A0ACC2JPL5_9PEZI|nr:hypothetical protein O1611_g4229 [Lasiodiplodia mahajangana]